MQSYWVTLATSDLERTRSFYDALGWRVRPGPPGVPCVTVHPHDGVTICFFGRDAFAPMVIGRARDPGEGREVVQSVALPQKSDIDALIARAEAAGAREIRRPAEAPFGYAGGFTDPDGHVFAALWMPT
jgi:predicted lactoylglutathione lyase